MKTLTPNQMILLLEIYRGTLRHVVPGGTYRDDLNRLVELGLIDRDHINATDRGVDCIAAMRTCTLEYTRQ